jgi:hypothetical protein
MSGPEVKWIGVAAWVEAAKRVVGADAWQRVLAGLAPETRALLASPPAAIAWVDAAHCFALYDAVVEHGGNGGTEIVREIARAQVQHDLRGIYRLFVRMASPDFIAQRAASLYGSYWRNHGTVRAERSGPHALDVVFEELPRVRPAFVSAQLGGIQGALEASGLKSIRVNIVHTTERSVRARASWG